MTRQTGRSYRMADHGAPSRQGLPGMYILTPEATRKCAMAFVSWNHTHTVFRILPQRNPEDPSQWDAFVLSEEPRDTGDWVRKYDIVYRLGSAGITFIAHGAEAGYDVSQHPVSILYRAITQAVSSGQGRPSWGPLVLSSGANDRKLVQPIRSLYLVQAVVMEQKSQPCNPPKGITADSKTQIMFLKGSAGEALLDLVDRFDDSQRRICPDLVSLSAGKFIDIHQEGTPPRGQAVAQQSQPRTLGGMAQALGATGAGSGGFDRYEATLLDTYNGWSPSLADQAELVAQKVQPWDEILYIPTMEEQFRLICSSGIPASAIVYALGDQFRDFIPEAIFQAAQAEYGNAQVAVPPTAPPGVAGDPGTFVPGTGSPFTPAAASPAEQGPAAVPGTPPTDGDATPPWSAEAGSAMPLTPAPASDAAPPFAPATASAESPEVPTPSAPVTSGASAPPIDMTGIQPNVGTISSVVSPADVDAVKAALDAARARSGQSEKQGG